MPNICTIYIIFRNKENIFYRYFIRGCERQITNKLKFIYFIPFAIFFSPFFVSHERTYVLISLLFSTWTEKGGRRTCSARTHCHYPSRCEHRLSLRLSLTSSRLVYAHTTHNTQMFSNKLLLIIILLAAEFLHLLHFFPSVKRHLRPTTLIPYSFTNPQHIVRSEVQLNLNISSTGILDIRYVSSSSSPHSAIRL